MAKQGLISLLFSCLLVAGLHVGFAGAGVTYRRLLAGGESPFTPRASLVRYWNNRIGNKSPKPEFLISKASPLSAVDAAAFAKLAGENGLSEHLPAFCTAANLLCFPELAASLEKHVGNSKFSSYHNENFTNYASGGLGDVSEFKKYSDDDNVLVDTFRRYSRDATGSDDKFDSYGTRGNVGDQRFDTYGTAETGGSGHFTNYNNRMNVPNLKFTSYSTDGNGRDQTFKSYSSDANAGDQSFASYGRQGNSAGNDFTSYGNSSNVIGSTFTGYGKSGNSAGDVFKSYGDDGNVPENTFRSYGEGGNAAVDSFTSYRDQANVGDDSFQSYAKDSNSAVVDFKNYGKSFNEGTDKFSGYGKGAQSEKIGFKGYGVNNTFKDYADKKSVSFKEYTKKTSSSSELGSSMAVSGKTVNKWVEPGKFFRESSLKKGTVMPFPDIRDKMPRRSFLPRTISSKLPFSTPKLPEMKQIFHADDNSTVESMFVSALADCEREPSRGETKRCVASVEDMIDFATAVLGRDVVVRSTENVNGAKQDVMIGTVKGINGGDVTESVSCHQSLYPYLLYYCHSVPKVRVYEADLLDPKSNAKINHGVAICHIDTTVWSATHGAFLALGSGPGKIEVCHWIFEGDMTWAKAD